MADLIEPYGGRLVDLLVGDSELERVTEEAGGAAKLALSGTALCDLELLATGGLSPLTGFMGREDYGRVVGEMRLGDGTLWPLPVTLDPRYLKL